MTEEYTEEKREKKAAYHTANRDKRLAYMRAYHAANREKRAAHERLRKYGLSKERFEALLTAQNASCAICKSTDPYGKGNFHVDHSHTTGEVRGLLCHHCNIGLGNFRDNPAFLQSAIGYLNE